MATNAELADRISALETRLAAMEAGGTTDLTAVESRLTALELHECPQEARITAIEARAASEAEAQDVLEADHIPEA